MNTKNSTHQQQSCRLVEFRVAADFGSLRNPKSDVIFSDQIGCRIYEIYKIIGLDRISDFQSFHFFRIRSVSGFQNCQKISDRIGFRISKLSKKIGSDRFSDLQIVKKNRIGSVSGYKFPGVFRIGSDFGFQIISFFFESDRFSDIQINKKFPPD